MPVRAYATFEDTVTPLPIEAAGDDPPPGREIAEALAAAFAAGGLKVIEVVHEHEGYGWAFTVDVGGRAVWCMLQASDRWLLITHVPRTLWERLAGRTFATAHEAAVAVIQRTLADSPRWRGVEWSGTPGQSSSGRRAESSVGEDCRLTSACSWRSHHAKER
jgi:hypothetical protein